MATKPTEKLIWALNDVTDPVTSAPNKRKPSSEFELEGLKRNEPLFRDHINWALNNVGLWIDYLENVNSTITQDKTLYISTTGNDTTGDGSLGNPYATLHAAFDSLNGVPIADNVVVTMSLEAGDYTFTQPLIITHPYAGRIEIVGAPLAGNRLSGCPLPDFSVDRESPSVPARTADQFYCSNASLGASSSASVADNARLSDMVLNKSLIQGRWSTTIQCNGCSGIVLRGATSLKRLDNIAILGDWDGVSNIGVTTARQFSGIELGEWNYITGQPTEPAGGSLYVGDNIVVFGFEGEGVKVRHGSSLLGSGYLSSLHNLGEGIGIKFGGIMSILGITSINNSKDGLDCNHGSMVRCNSIDTSNKSYFCGNRDNGLACTENSVIRASSGVVGIESHANGANGVNISRASSTLIDYANIQGNRVHGILCSESAAATATYAQVVGNDTHGVFADLGSTIDLKGGRCKNHGGIGLFSVSGSTIRALLATTLGNNVLWDIEATYGSTVVMDDGVLFDSGSKVIATGASQVRVGNKSGVTYSPAFGTTGNNNSIVFI